MPIIQDRQIYALSLVVAGRLNASTRLRTDLRDTLSIALPVSQILLHDPGDGRVAYGENTSFPILAIWRQENEYFPETVSRRGVLITIGIKIVLPAINDTALAMAVLNRYTEAIDEAFDDSFEDQWGGDILKAANFIYWERRWKMRFTYEGPEGQTLYPTATGSGKAQYDRGFDPNYLPDESALLNVNGLMLEENLKGLGSDGDQSPAFNPLVGVLLPTTAPINAYAPPAARP